MSKYYIIAGTHDQYLKWRHTNYPKMVINGEIQNLLHLVYVSGIDSLKGVSNPRGIFIGTWYKRLDIEQILFQLQCQGSLLDTQKMSNLLSIVEKNK